MMISHPVGAVQFKGPGLDAIALKPKLLIEMLDGTGVVAVHPSSSCSKPLARVQPMASCIR